MEQAEKVCDHVCIIALDNKVLDGPLRDLKRASAAKELVSIGFVEADVGRRFEVVVPTLHQIYVAKVAAAAAVAERREDV
jgi:ABC-type uncharacterized transport system ATPase subunit